ncbi:MAG: aryl-sulfate sulfotransferase N-terminal domain-containing protein [Clostridia bacterium]|nr:aryl-sulfate sulfotransferase N-terminal domain-containing protein [Clostridia bacterium]
MTKLTKSLLAAIAVLLASIAAFAFVACGEVDTRAPHATPVNIELEVGADRVTVDITHTDTDTRTLEFGIDGVNWQDEPIITGLKPDTEYTVYVRYKEDERCLASDVPFTQKIKTLKFTQDAPDVEIVQEYKTVSFAANPDLEFSYDGGNTYVAENTHTYTEYGAVTVKVRYKETSEKYSGTDKEFKIRISDFYGGMGTESNPYLINSVEEFLKIETTRAHFKLLKDLDFSQTQAFYPLRCNSLDGNEKKLTAPHVYSDKDEGSASFAAIFAEIGLVKDLTVENAVIEWDRDGTIGAEETAIAVLAGRAAELENCSVSGSISIKGDNYYPLYVGGLVGKLTNSFRQLMIEPDNLYIKSCKADVSAISSVEDNSYRQDRPHFIGGLVGSIEAKDFSAELVNSYAAVDFELKDLSSGYIGGIIGRGINVNVKNCYSTGTIVKIELPEAIGANKLTMIGGIAAYMLNCNIDCCYSDINLSADGHKYNTALAGIAALFTGDGENENVIKNCLFAGNLYVNSDGTTAVALDTVCVTLEDADVSNCYHIEGVASDLETDKSTAVSEATAKTAEWQQNVLKFSAENWNIKEGEYPSIK